MSRETSAKRIYSPDAEASFKLKSWQVTQEEIMKMLKTPANLNDEITLTHSPQLLQTLHSGAPMSCMVHFRASTGEVFTGASKNRQLYVWTLNNKNSLLTELEPMQKLKAPGEITCMVFIPKHRTYVGYSTDKTLRVMMDPVTGCEDIAYLIINHVITCLTYNKDKNEIVAGGKGFLESYPVEGTEFRTRIKKATPIKAVLEKNEDVKDLLMDTRNKQILVLSSNGMNVVNYSTGHHTHILVNRHSGVLTCCCIYHDGEFLVTGSSDGDLKIWNAVVFTQVHEFPGHVEKVTAICALPKDPVLFSSSSDGTVYVWRMDTFQKFMKLRIGDGVCSLRVLRNGTLVAQTANAIMTYSLKQFYTTFTSCSSGVVILKRLRSHGNGANKIMVSTEDGRFQLYNPVTGALISAMLPLPKHQIVKEMAYNAKDGRMYVVLKTGDVLLLSTLTHPFRALEVLHPPATDFKVTCLAVMVVSIESAEAGGETVEDTVIFMGTSSGAICVMESKALLMETPIQAHAGGFVTMSSSCDVDPVSSRLRRTSRYLVTAGNDNLVKLWGLDFIPGQGGWTLALELVQNIDCMGSPSHVAMFENIICVAFGDYGLVKMFRLAGLNKKDNRSELQGLYVLLTHFSQFDHSDTVTALDMCPMINIFVTCGTDGHVKIWDTNNQLIREMSFGQPVSSVCFANNRGDLLIGFQNKVLLVPIIKYMPQFMLEQMSGRMFVDEETESPIEVSTKKKKIWFDPKAIPKYSTDLVARMTQKVKQKANLTDDEAEALTLERMRSDISSESGIGTSIVDDDSRPALTRENTSLSLNDALEREKSNVSLETQSGSGSRADVRSGRASRNRKERGKKRQLDDLDFRKVSIGETLEEADEEDAGAPTSKELRLARQDSLLYFRKPSVWSWGLEITPEVLRDLEKTANMSRHAEFLLPDYLQPQDEVKMVTPEPQKGPIYTAEELKSLTPWERFLLTKKPIIAPDGYIPNSVVRRAVGFVKPESPMLPWQLKPVPDADPKHMPAGWKPKNEKSSSSFDGFLSNEEDVDLDNIMDMKRQTTLQSVKVQQSIKEASLYIGTSMCLLPDGTEPEAVPNFSWKSAKDEVADLSPLTRPRSEDMTPAKEISFVTPVPVKPSPEEGKTTKFEYKTQTKPLKKVDIDIGSGLNFGIGGPRAGPLINKLQKPPEEEKTKSFRLSQAPKTPQDGPNAAAGEGGQKPSLSDGQRTGSSPSLSQASTLTSAQGAADKADPGTKQTRKDSIKKEKKADGPAGGKKAGKAARNPIAAPTFKKLTKEEELTLLQKIVKEEWFPPGIPPILDLVNDELTKLLETTDTKVFVAVCDYIVQIFQQLSIGPKYMNRASDKLTKQLNGPSATARKKAVWTMKQLGLAAKKDVISTLLPGLLDAKEGSREELISNLGELLSGPGAADGLTTLMSSLGISNRPLCTKEEQQAAIKAISEKLQAEAEKLKGGSADSVKQRVEMWVSSLNLPSDGSSLQVSRTSNNRGLDSSGNPMGLSGGLDTEGSFDKSSRQSTRGSRRKSRGGGAGKKGTKSKGKRSRQKSSSLQPGEDKDDMISVDMSVQTDPRSGDVGDDEDIDLIRKRRGRWRRGGLSQFREGTDVTDEEDDEFDADDEDDEGIYDDANDEGGGRPRRRKRRDKGGEGDEEEKPTSGTFIRIEYDLTPGMFRSETGGSEWSDDLPPPSNTTPGRPKGASVHKFYARRDHVAIVEQDPSRAGSLFPTMPSIEEPNGKPKDPNDRYHPTDYDSDLHSESNYTEISKAFTARDGVSIGDSGIGKDMSETSSHVHGRSDSLYEQGRPRLSPIKSQTKLNADGKKEPDWKDFFESEKVQEKRKTVGFSRKDTVQQVQGEPHQIYDQSGRIAVLPPIMYVDPEHPTLPGEAGLRLLHSIRWADKERTLDGGGRLVEALPGRLTITTHDEPVGDTTYGFLQMHWTTQVPAVNQTGFHTDRTGHTHLRKATDGYGENQIREPTHGFSTYRGAEQQHVVDKTNLPRLPQRAGTMIKKNGPQQEKPTAKRENTLPVLPRERSEFQWSKPMAPAPKRVSLCEAGAPGQEDQPSHCCDQYKWATKKMHHYISPPKSIALPKTIKGSTGREHSILNTSLDSDVMSVLAHSSVSLMPAMSLEKLMKTIKMAPPPSL